MSTEDPKRVPTGSGESAPRRRTILVVDDETDMLENITRIFRRTPHECLTAAGGREALALLERHLPDLVLTDLRMPGLDGLALLRAIKRVSPDTPVVIFTAYASDSAAGEAIRAGATAFLPKPFSAAQLLETVQDALAPLDARRPPPA